MSFSPFVPPSSRKEAWQQQPAAASKPRAAPRLEPLQPHPQTTHYTSSYTYNNIPPPKSRQSLDGPLLPYLTASPSSSPPHVPSYSSPRRGHSRRTSTGGRLGALAQTPVGSHTNQAITQLYTVYNINGVQTNNNNTNNNNNKKSRRQLRDASSTIDSASSTLNPALAMIDHPALTHTIQHGTHLPIPDQQYQWEHYQQAVLAQQQYQLQQQQLQPQAAQPPQSQSVYPHDQPPSDSDSISISPLTPQPPAASPPPTHRTRPPRAAYNTTSTNKNETIDEKVNETTIITYPAPHIHPSNPPPYDDSDEPIVVYDRSHLPLTDAPHMVDPTRDHYVISEGPSYTRTLGHLYGGGEELSGTGGSAPLTQATPTAIDNQNNIIDTNHHDADKPSNTLSNSASSSSADFMSSPHVVGAALDLNPNAWKDHLYAFLSNDEHQRRLLRFDLHATSSSNGNLFGAKSSNSILDVSPDPSDFTVTRHDMDLFSAVKDDSILYFRSFESDGRSFGSLDDLARATEYAHGEWLRRRAAAYKIGTIDIPDDEIQMLLQYLKSSTTHLFDHAENVSVSKRDLLAMLQQVSGHMNSNSDAVGGAGGSVAQATIRHLTLMDQAQRHFPSFSNLLYALTASIIDEDERMRIRNEIRTYLNSNDCKLFRKVGQSVDPVIVSDSDIARLCATAPRTLAMPPAEPLHGSGVHIGIPEQMVPYLIQQLEHRGGTWCATFDAFLKALRGEKRRFAQLLQQYVKRGHGPTMNRTIDHTHPLADVAVSVVSPPSIVELGELPSVDLYDDDLLRLFVESGVGLDLSRHFQTLAWEFQENTTSNHAQPYFHTVTDLITKLKQLHRYWSNRRTEVLSYLSSPSCALFHSSSTDILLTLSDVDRLLDDSGCEPDTIEYLKVFDAGGRHFTSFETCLQSLKHTSAIVHQRKRQAKEEIQAFLEKGTIIKNHEANGYSDATLERLLTAGGAGGQTTLTHLESFERQGYHFSTIDELITIVHEAHVRAVETKRLIWSNLHSTSSRIIMPLAQARKAAANQAIIMAQQQQQQQHSSQSKDLTRIGGAARKSTRVVAPSTSSNFPTVTVADQPMVASTAADTILLADGDVSRPLEDEAKLPRTSPVAVDSSLAMADEGFISITTSTSASSSSTTAPLSTAPSLPTSILSNSEVEQLFKDGFDGDDTLVQGLWQFELDGKRFETLEALITAMQHLHQDQRTFRSTSRRCVLHFLASPSCQLFGHPIELRRQHLDELLEAGGNHLPLIMFHLNYLNRKVTLELKQFDTFAELMSSLHTLHLASITHRENLYTFLSSNDCAFWCDTVSSRSCGGLMSTPRHIGEQLLLEPSRPQVTREECTRLYIEGLAGPDTIQWIRRIQLRAIEHTNKPTITATPATTSTSAAPFHPFPSMLELTVSVRASHATLLRHQLQLLRFFNAPYGSPGHITSVYGSEADATLWSTSSDDATAISAASTPSSSGGYSVYDLIETNGRDLKPLRIDDLHKLSEQCQHASLDVLYTNLLAMSRDQCEKAASDSTSHLGRTSVTNGDSSNNRVGQLYRNYTELQHALSERIRNLDSEARAKQKALLQPIERFLNEEYRGFTKRIGGGTTSTSSASSASATSTNINERPVYNDDDVLHLMRESGADGETFDMVKEVAISGIHTPTKDDLIRHVRAHYTHLTETRNLLQQHLTSPYCELFLNSSTTLPVSWVFPHDIDRLLTETWSNEEPNLERSKYNYRVLQYLNRIELRKVAIGSWNYLITRLRELDREEEAHQQWQHKLIAEVITNNNKLLFSSSSFGLTSTHLNKLLSICDNDGRLVVFLISHCFLSPTEDHSPFTSFQELCLELERMFQKALKYQKECYEVINMTTTKLIQSHTNEGGEGLMSRDGLLTIAPISDDFELHAVRSPLSSSTLGHPLTHSVWSLISLSSICRMFHESLAGFRLKVFLETFQTSGRTFRDIFELTHHIRQQVETNQKVEKELYQYFHASAQEKRMELFAYAPNTIVVSHADCTRLLLESDAGTQTLSYVRALNDSGHHFDEFSQLILAVRDRNLRSRKEQHEFNTSLRMNRTRIADALMSSTLFPRRLDLNVGDVTSNELIDAVLAAGSGSNFDRALWEGAAIEGGRKEVVHALTQHDGTIAEDDDVRIDDPSYSSSSDVDLKFSFSGSSAVSKTLQLLHRLESSSDQWSFGSLHELIPILRMEYNKNEKTVASILTWLRSEECRLFVEIEPTKATTTSTATQLRSPSKQMPTDTASAPQRAHGPAPVTTPVEPRVIRTLAHSLTMHDVDSSLLEKGEYYARGNAPEYALDDLLRLQGNVLRTSKNSNEAGSASSSSSVSSSLGAFHLSTLSTFRSLDSLARALNIVHKDRTALAAAQEESVLQFIVNPQRGLLRMGEGGNDIEVRRSHIRHIISSSPIGKPLLHLEYLSNANSSFATIDGLIHTIDRLAHDRHQQQQQLLTMLTLPAPQNVIFRRMPPADIITVKHINRDLIEKMMTESGAERRTLAYLQLMVKRASVQQHHARSASKSGVSSSPSSHVGASLGFQTFAALLSGLSRFHLDYSSQLVLEQTKLLAWFSGPACHLFQRAMMITTNNTNNTTQTIRFTEEELEGFFMTLPPDDTDEPTSTSQPYDDATVDEDGDAIGVPPESFALGLLKQLDAEGAQFTSLRECIRHVHRLHGRNLRSRHALLKFFDSRSIPNSNLFHHSPLGVIHVGEHEVERLWSETGAKELCLRYLYHLEYSGRTYANVDELVTEVKELHRQAAEKDQAEKEALLAYLTEQSQQIPVGVHFDSLSVTRLLIASQSSAILTKTYLQYLDEIGEGLLPLPGNNDDNTDRANSVGIRLESRLRDLAKAAHAQKRELFTFLSSPACRLFSHSLRGDEILPSFTKIDSLWLGGEAGLETLTYVRRLNDAHRKFEDYDELMDGVRREVLKMRTKKEEMVRWLQSKDCNIFQQCQTTTTRPTFHTSEMTLLLPTTTTSSSMVADVVVDVSVDADPHLDTLTLLKSFSSGPSRHKFVNRFTNISELATIFRPIQNNLITTFKRILQFLTTPKECHFFIARSYGVHVTPADVSGLIQLVGQLAAMDELDAANELELHLLAFEAAQRRFADWNELRKVLRSAVLVERSYPALDSNGDPIAADADVPLDVSRAVYGLSGESASVPFVATAYSIGVLATQVGAGKRLDRTQAEWYQAHMQGKQKARGTTNDKEHATIETTIDPPAERDDSSSAVATSASLDPPLDLLSHKQFVYTYLWSPSCTFLSAGSDLVTSVTVDALFAIVPSQPLLVMEYLHRIAADGIIVDDTNGLIEQVKRMHYAKLEEIEESLLIAQGHQPTRKSAATNERPKSISLAMTPIRSGERPTTTGASAYSPLTPDQESIMNLSTRFADVAIAEGDIDEYDSTSSPPSEEDFATAKEIVSQKQSTFIWLGSVHCSLLPLSTALSESEVARIYSVGGAGIRTRAILEQLEQAKEHFTSIDQLVTAVKATREADHAARQTIYAILTNPRCCLLYPLAPSASSSSSGSIHRVSHGDVSTLISSCGAGSVRSVSLLKQLHEQHAQCPTGKPAFQDLKQLARGMKRLHEEEIEMQNAILNFAHSKACVLFKGVTSIVGGKIRPSDALRLMLESNAGDETPELLLQLNAALIADARQAEKLDPRTAVMVWKRYRYLEDIITALESLHAESLARRTRQHGELLQEFLVTSNIFEYNIVQRPGELLQKQLTPKEREREDAFELERTIQATQSDINIPTEKPKIGYRYTIEEVLPLLHASPFKPYSDSDVWCDSLRTRVQSHPDCIRRPSAESVITLIQSLASDGIVVADCATLLRVLEQYGQSDLARRAAAWSLLQSHGPTLFGSDSNHLPVLMRDVHQLLDSSSCTSDELRMSLPTLLSSRARAAFSSWHELSSVLRSHRLSFLSSRARSSIIDYLSDPSSTIFGTTLVHQFTNLELDRLRSVAHGNNIPGVDTGNEARIYFAYLQTQNIQVDTIEDAIAQIKVIRVLLMQDINRNEEESH